MVILNIDWNSFLFGDQDISFLIIVALRTFSMFLIILIGLRVMGKSSVSQLSIFELGIIIGLGSAAGDPMFYKEVGIVFAILVFVVVIVLYHIMKYLLSRNENLDRWVEGEPKDIVLEGKFLFKTLAKEPLTKGELFSQLRSYNITHLGQIKQAILEQSGKVNVFYYLDEDVKFGLPILPQALKNCSESIAINGMYSCGYCSFTGEMQAAQKVKCTECGKMEWVESYNEKRIT